MKHKFFEFKNEAGGDAELYLYGTIVGEKDEFFGSESDVDINDFKQALDGVTGTLNIYINSGGGSVFIADAMTALLQRAKDKGVKVKAYIDGLCASASTFIAMVADEINVYRNSIMMIHKPIGAVYGNATEMKKMINTLDVIENSMLNLYEHKAKVDRERIKSMVDKETWLDANGIAENFNVNMVDSDKKVVACVDFENCGYKIPPEMAQKLNALETVDKTPEETAEAPQNGAQAVTDKESTVDYSDIENIINTIKGE